MHRLTQIVSRRREEIRFVLARHFRGEHLLFFQCEQCVRFDFLILFRYLQFAVFALQFDIGHRKYVVERRKRAFGGKPLA
jgi:hypothetical protein